MKRKFLILICLLSLVPAFAFESKHRFSAGCSYCGTTYKNEENELDLKNYPLPFISYEFLFTPFEYEEDIYLAFEAGIGINPVENVYSVSLNAKFYFSAIFYPKCQWITGFSLLSHCNFGNLKYRYLNYRMGIILVGCNCPFNKHWNFETNVLLDYTVKFDSMDVYINCNIGYTL